MPKSVWNTVPCVISEINFKNERIPVQLNSFYAIPDVMFAFADNMNFIHFCLMFSENSQMKIKHFLYHHKWWRPIRFSFHNFVAVIHAKLSHFKRLSRTSLSQWLRCYLIGREKVWKPITSFCNVLYISATLHSRWSCFDSKKCFHKNPISKQLLYGFSFR